MMTLLILAAALLAMLGLALMTGRALAAHVYEMTNDELIENSLIAEQDGDTDNMYLRELQRRQAQ
jgi:hypothetical protein